VSALADPRAPVLGSPDPGAGQGAASRQLHWQGIYSTKNASEVSWYRPHLERSLALIDACRLPPEARLVDIGGGASTLVDDLLARGFSSLAVVDLAGAALDISRQRLGARGAVVDWVVGDATQPLLETASVDLWHDRAVFHFLTDEGLRAAYVEQMLRCIKPGGHALISTFSPEGPERCSGLPIVRYDAAGLAAALGQQFSPVASFVDDHQTPRGGHQSFLACLFRRADPAPAR